MRVALNDAVPLYLDTPEAKQVEGGRSHYADVHATCAARGADCEPGPGMQIDYRHA
jgi:hypothetical protein